LCAVAVPACGVAAALGIYGVRKYMDNAKQAEARHALPAFAGAIVECARGEGVLPSTSAPVPGSLTSVSRQKYQSAAQDWSSDPTLACSRFTMTGPQYYQYQWVLEGPTQGRVQALADLDGNGAPDHPLSLRVSCSTAGACSAAPTFDPPQ
jgi:hypothetical protein